MPFLVYYRALLLVCNCINLYLLTKQHFPSLWWMCVGVQWVLLLPSKSWAYWGNPAARSQSHASFASISETQESVCFKTGIKSDIHPHEVIFILKNQLKQQKTLCTWYPTNTTALGSFSPGRFSNWNPPCLIFFWDNIDVMMTLLVSLSGWRYLSLFTWRKKNTGPYITNFCLFTLKTTYGTWYNNKLKDFKRR